MKKLLFCLFIFLTGFFVKSCDRNDGDWDDNIKLSKKIVNFDSNPNSITITTQTKNWWIDAISLNGNDVNLTVTNTTQQNFVIDNSEFKVERKDGNKIIINMTENNTNFERTIKIGLQNGNYFDGIKITQAK